MYDDFVIPQYQRLSLPLSKLHGFYSILFFFSNRDDFSDIP